MVTSDPPLAVHSPHQRLVLVAGRGDRARRGTVGAAAVRSHTARPGL